MERDLLSLFEKSMGRSALGRIQFKTQTMSSVNLPPDYFFCVDTTPFQPTLLQHSVQERMDFYF